MARIAIMQGRLVPPEPGRFQSFPRSRWRDEFALAAEAGLDAIEWIYDLYGEDVNPLGSEFGIAEIQRLSEQSGVGIFSVCADYFMDRPIARATNADRTEIIERLQWLIGQCSRAGIERMVLPFVDQSRIENSADCDLVVDVLTAMAPIAEASSVELHVESSLAPADLRELMDRLPQTILKVNYDSGNSCSQGYEPAREFAAYGARIGSVHIKDRKLGGGTVPLGTGDADLEAVFLELEKVGYRGDYVLQVAREQPGGEVAWARQNLALVQHHLRSRV